MVALICLKPPPACPGFTLIAPVDPLTNVPDKTFSRDSFCVPVAIIRISPEFVKPLAAVRVAWLDGVASMITISPAAILPLIVLDCP